MRGCTGVENSEPSKGTFRMNVHTKYQLLRSIWRGDREGTLNSSFSRSKRRKPSISPLLIDLGRWFLDMLCNFWLVWKGKIFCVFDLSAPPSPNWGINEFLPKFIPTHIYLIHRQIKPIDRIGAMVWSVLRRVNEFSVSKKIIIKISNGQKWSWSYRTLPQSVVGW